MIDAINLCKQYGDKKALNDLNLTINKGEIFALLGHNGAGKSTTINCFLGFIKPTSGKALVDGVDVEENINLVRKKIAYIPDNVVLYPELTALKNLAFFSSIAGLSYSQDELSRYLEKVQLPANSHNRKLGNFSKGMRQKVGIAIAIAKKTSVLFLDEPTSSLDPEASNKFSTIISNLRDEGNTVLMASHDLFRSKNLADRIGIMKNGKLEKIINSNDVTPNELEELYLKTV